MCEVIAEVEIDHTAGNLSVLVSNSRVWCFLPALRSRNKRRQGQRIELTIQPPNTAAICNQDTLLNTTLVGDPVVASCSTNLLSAKKASGGGFKGKILKRIISDSFDMFTKNFVTSSLSLYYWDIR